MKPIEPPADADNERDAIIASLREMAPFDVSPRGVTFRPSGALEAQLRTIIKGGNKVVPILAQRLSQTRDAWSAIVWLYCLKNIGTVEAENAIQNFVATMESQNLWAGQFPGQREIKLFLGIERGDLNA